MAMESRADAGRMARIRRFLAVLAFAFWFGGQTLYALVLIPTAHEILKSHLRVGFVTQGVTNWINAAGAGALILLLWDLRAGRKARACGLRLATWIVMDATQGGLFCLHPVLDRFLDSQTREMLEPDRFYALHRVYLLLTTVQWISALAHLWGFVRSWGIAPERDTLLAGAASDQNR